MKRMMVAIVIAMSAITAMAQVSAPLSIGSTAPMADVKMKSVSGTGLSIKDAMKKNGVLVMFSCNTCPYVVKYQKRTLETIKEATKRNIGVIIVNSNEENRTEADSYAAMKQYAKAQGYTVPYVVDNKSAMADAFGATRTPECFLFDASGKLIYHGAIDDNATAAEVSHKYLFAAINENIAGKEVSVKEARSIGCMIKRAE